MNVSPDQSFIKISKLMDFSNMKVIPSEVDAKSCYGIQNNCPPPLILHLHRANPNISVDIIGDQLQPCLPIHTWYWSYLQSVQHNSALSNRFSNSCKLFLFPPDVKNDVLACIITKQRNKDNDNDGSDYCDYNFGTFDFDQ